MRIVIISHGHPDFAPGGGEVAAYNLFKGFSVLAEHEAWFLARAPKAVLHPGTLVALHREREYLFGGEGTVQDLTATVELDRDDEFAALLKRIKPDVIHFHHYYKVGVELIRLANQVCPRARLVMTLHEYMAICTNYGTMVKPTMQLCHGASPQQCAQCFPDKGADWFFLRERYIKSFFARVDSFISPSHFLANRYLEWGLPADKLQVIENGIPSGKKLPPRKLRPGEQRTRFAYFGQAHRYKGLELIMNAFGAIPPKLRRTISLNIHASGLDDLNANYRKRLEKLMKQHADVVSYHGPYAQSDLPRLMGETDWVVMGSIWWENSPLVIQEAHKFGRPVIAPDLGGMAEKVVSGEGGLLFRAFDEVALRSLIEMISSGTPPVAYEALIARLPDYTTVESSVAQHLQIYRKPRRQSP